MSTLTDHWRDSVASVWKSHWGDPLVVTTRTDTQTITGVVSQVTGEQLDEEGFQIITHDAEILFATADVNVCIEEGTRILHTISGKVVTYEVASDGGAPAWEYDDPEHIKTRVRVKRMGVEDALP